MIITVDKMNLLQAAMIHSISWKESHRFVCVPDFVEMQIGRASCRERVYVLV